MVRPLRGTVGPAPCLLQPVCPAEATGRRFSATNGPLAGPRPRPWRGRARERRPSANQRPCWAGRIALRRPPPSRIGLIRGTPPGVRCPQVGFHPAETSWVRWTSSVPGSGPATRSRQLNGDPSPRDVVPQAPPVTDSVTAAVDDVINARGKGGATASASCPSQPEEALMPTTDPTAGPARQQAAEPSRGLGPGLVTPSGITASQVRQGDVLLVPVDEVPDTARPVARPRPRRPRRGRGHRSRPRHPLARGNPARDGRGALPPRRRSGHARPRGARADQGCTRAPTASSSSASTSRPRSRRHPSDG